MKQAICGIYVIENTVTGQRYVGSSNDIHRRLLAHRAHLRRGVHSNSYLQRAWNKYGEDAFMGGQFEDECEPNELLEIEQEVVDLIGHYNLNKKVNRPPSRKGAKVSAKTRELLRRAITGKILGPRPLDVCARISAAQIGKKRSPASIAKGAAALTGRKASATHRANISAALSGRTLSDAHRARLGEARRRTVARKAAATQ